MIELTAHGLQTLAPSVRPTIEIHTLADTELDARSEYFFECVERLIFGDRGSESRKAAILRRYSRMLRKRGERKLADDAHQLAETYVATISQFH